MTASNYNVYRSRNSIDNTTETAGAGFLNLVDAELAITSCHRIGKNIKTYKELEKKY